MSEALPLPARAARKAAGFTTAEAAKRLRFTPGYLCQLEREGGWTEHKARQAAALYGVDMTAFLRPPGRRTRRPAKRGGRCSRSAPHGDLG